MRSTLISLLALLPLTLSPAYAQEQSQTDSVEAQLCRNQLDLLLSREKLTEEEEAVFKAQCDCLERKAKSSDPSPRDCAQAHE